MTMLRKSLAGAGALLVLFHVWLFAGQAWDGQLAEPLLVLRWLLSGGLIAALAGLRRQGASMFVGRKAAAVWLLAALLHAPSVTDRAGAPGEPALPEAAIALLRGAVASTLAVGLGVLFALAMFGGRARPLRRLAFCSAPARVGAFSSTAFVVHAPRPPPAA
jgi:hypothetical protein